VKQKFTSKALYKSIKTVLNLRS